MASSPSAAESHRPRIAKPGDETALEAFLVQHAPSSMFLRSNLRRAGLEDRGEFYQATYAALWNDGAIVAVAAHAWNGVVVLQAPADDGRVALAAVAASGRAVTGIVGPLRQARAARRALGLDDRPTTMNSVEDLLRLSLSALAVPTPLARGRVRCRPAEERDHALLTEWRIADAQESLGRRATPELGRACRSEIEMLGAERCLFVLEADRLLSCCSFNATLPDKVQVGGVFTPLLLRNKGYARAVVAGALLAARAQGVREAILFTGRDNAAAQAAYRALGFERIGDYALIHFEP